VRRRGRAILALAATAAVGGATGLARGELDRLAAARTTESELLYLPNGKYLRAMSLGHASLLADAVYLWAIQYYSNYDREDRHRYVEHVFGRVITELDPHYVDAYWLGALILILEAGDLDAGLALLDKFEQAAAVPGVPAVVTRMRAGMTAKAGELDQAIEQWRALLQDPASDPRTVAIARRQVRELHVRADLQRLQAAVLRFRGENGRNPARLAELVARDYIPSLPLDPDGASYAYDPQSGRVSSSSGRLLGGAS
jgi:hypothetical protein